MEIIYTTLKWYGQCLFCYFIGKFLHCFSNPQRCGSEIQERLDKIGTGRPFAPVKETVDYSEISARLPQPPKRQYEFTDHPNPSYALPEAISIPIAIKLTERSEPGSISIASFERPSEAVHSPKTTPQSKGRSSWKLWPGVALFVAFVIAQLIW